jgi:glycosyltransferase involved in cell wall biosynthesis
MGIDTQAFTPRRHEKNWTAFRVGFAGNITQAKGIPELLNACHRLRLKGVDLELLLAGPLLDEETRCRLDSSDWVVYRGVVQNSDMPTFLRDLDVFVMPTRVSSDHEEHDGRVVLEAMAVGLPCVVTRSGILPELVDERCGCVCGAEDPAALEAALGELASHPQNRISMGKKSRELAECVGNSAHAHERYRLLTSLMGNL